jgi:hypothetical protein
MKRFVAAAAAVVPFLGAITLACAQAPEPKVTVNGIIDVITTLSKNWASLDVTDGGKDQSWYSRERGVFTITGEVGRTKGVLSIEMDAINGAGTVSGGNTNSFDLDTDLNDNVTQNGGFLELKWLYLETPITGPGSLLPFVPIPTTLRAGAQPARGHSYKFGVLFSGDFPGVTLETGWAPNLRSTVTYAQIGEGLDKITAPNRVTNNEDWAMLASVEFAVFTRLLIKPTYAYADYTCGNAQGTGALGMEAKNGFAAGFCTALTDRHFDTRRHTIGGDIWWTTGTFTVQPTFLYQFGEQGIGTPDGHTVAIQTWILDTIARFRTGAFNIEGRFMWTPGMRAEDTVQAGRDTIRYYQSINSGFGYMAGWAEIQSVGVEYAGGLLSAAPGVALRQSPSYDKYGRIFAAVAADYVLTPALTLKGLVNMSWTDKAVDTHGTLGGLGLTSTGARGTERYLGTEINLGLTYWFAPNVAFDLMGAYLFAGNALDHANTPGGDVKDADDVYKAVARVRFAF